MRGPPRSPSRSAWSGTSSRTAACGIASRSLADRTMSAGMIASVRGTRTRTVVPSPGRLWMSTVPPIASMLVFTTSIPTPRPETLVTAAAVEKPGSKMNCNTRSSGSAAASSAATSPRATAFARTADTAIPPPSSSTSIVTWPLSLNARRASLPTCGLPRAARTSGGSMPWSTALRTRCVSGSRMLSISVRSSSVSPPSIDSCTSLPQETARSRTVRGNLLKTCSIGCSRVLTAVSWRALVTVLMRWAAASTAGSVVSMLRSSLRASTSSPTRSRIEPTSPTSTRIELSLTERSAAGGFSGEGVAGGGFGALDAATAAAGGVCACTGTGGAGSTPSPAATAVSRCARSRKSWSPSLPVVSIVRKIARTASTIEYSEPVTRSSNVSLPSRSRPSRCSPECVRAPSFANPKNPLLPLIVWTVRKMLASRSSSPGACSRAIRSRSSWSRFSVDSTRNSWTNSSLSFAPTTPEPPFVKHTPRNRHEPQGWKRMVSRRFGPFSAAPHAGETV